MTKILVIDDSETQRFEVKFGLTAAGYEVLEAADGSEGLACLNAARGEIALVICDVNMPIMDGLTMCSLVFESGKFPGLPIFMLTTEASPELKLKGKSVGVRLWITKPFNTVKLVDAVRRVLEKK